VIDGLLGTDKDVEALARRARRAGWVVDTDGRTHLRWRSPRGQEFRSPLTGGRGVRLRVERELAARDPGAFGELAPAVARRAADSDVSQPPAVLAPSELAFAAAELAALAELLGELGDGRSHTADDLVSAADAVRIGRDLLRDAEGQLRAAGRGAR
jgi:hypothetical protein